MYYCFYSFPFVLGYMGYIRLHCHAAALSWEPSAFWENEFPSYRRLSYKAKFYLIIDNSQIVCCCLSMYILTSHQPVRWKDRLSPNWFKDREAQYRFFSPAIAATSFRDWDGFWYMPLLYLSIVTSMAFWYSLLRDELCLLSDFSLTIIV